MARVVMLTAAAGPGLDLQYGDVFETDQASADRLIALGSAREVGPEDKDAPVKRESKVGSQVTSDESSVVASEVASDELRDSSEEDREESAAAPVRRASTRRR